MKSYGRILTSLLGSTLVFSSPLFAQSTFTVSNTNQAGPGSLYQAVLDSNTTTGTESNLINFALQGAGPHTIMVEDSIVITRSVEIDGLSQIGSSFPLLPVQIQQSGNGEFLTLGTISVSIKGIHFTTSEQCLTVNASSLQLERNVFLDCIDGAVVGNSLNSRIDNNFFQGIGRGIVGNHLSLTVTENDFSLSEDGVSGNIEDGAIYLNYFRNTAEGLNINGNDNEVYQNVFSANYSGASINGRDNRIYSNSFISNVYGLSTNGVDNFSDLNQFFQNKYAFGRGGFGLRASKNIFGSNSLSALSFVASSLILNPFYEGSGSLRLLGSSSAGATIEVFFAQPGATVTQGQSYLFSVTEGSSQDLNPDAGQFEFLVAVPSTVTIGVLLTATETYINNDTSSFIEPISVSEGSCPIDQFFAEYFPISSKQWYNFYAKEERLEGILLQSDPISSSCIPSVDFLWMDSSPLALLRTNLFASRYSGLFTLPAGTYRFAVSADDKIRLFLDDEEIAEGIYWHQGEKVYEVNVSDGYEGSIHRILIEHVEGWHWAQARVRWERVS